MVTRFTDSFQQGASLNPISLCFKLTIYKKPNISGFYPKINGHVTFLDFVQGELKENAKHQHTEGDNSGGVHVRRHRFTEEYYVQ